jgi:hypothetical protein
MKTEQIVKEITVDSLQQLKKNNTISSDKKQKGHKLFCYDTARCVLKEVEYKKSTSDLNGVIVHDVIAADGKIYFQALRKKSAADKMRKRGYKLIFDNETLKLL